MTQQIRVGVVGASLDRGWATGAHLPALAHLDEFTVTAVATTRLESARQTAAAFGIPHAFADAGDLAAHPDVDLVVASVKAPDHAGVIRAALASGKHVLSEWPLGVNVDEASELAAAADAAGVVNAAGLQGYHSPGARFVSDLLTEGRIGRVESVSVIAAGDPLGGSRLPQVLAYSADPAAGNTVLSVMAGHMLGALDQVVGSPVDVSAIIANLHGHVVIEETGESVLNGAAGQVALHGLLDSGAVLSLSIHGGNAPTPDGFVITIAGTDGTVTITPRDPGHYVNWAHWLVRVRTNNGAPTELAIPEHYLLTPPGLPAGPVASVAAVYREIAQAIAENRQAHPSFGTALRVHRVLAAAERAAETGARQSLQAVVRS
jgi:predicted dehydrogenase